jgi:hypothetical protein
MLKWQWILVLLVSLVMVTGVGCSSGSNDTPDGDQTDGDVDGDVDGDEDGDQVDGDQVDGDEDGDQVDGDQIDGDEEIVCLCSEVTDCCDGCNPINDAGFCDDGSLCTENDTCDAGACEGVAIDCSATNFCQLDGTCDETTGACGRDFMPNGTTCTPDGAEEGTGICLQGECGGFGECDVRTYGQPAKFPCNVNSECEGGLCVEMDVWYTYCSQPCGVGLDDCPADMDCVDMGDLGSVCELANREDTLPGAGRLDIYQACNADEDCAGGLCLALGSEKFCTTNCEDTTRGADGAICGDCGDCRDGGVDLGFPFEYYCIPAGTQKTGEACELNLDCDSRVCFNNYCTDQCVDVGGVDTCPDGFTCVPNSAEDIVGYSLERNFAMCVLDSELGVDFGLACGFDWQCDSNSCQDVAGDMLCVADCMTEACTEGVCTQTSQVIIDTMMELWADGGEAALTSDDDGGEGALSKITYNFSTAGTYFVKVKGYSTSTNGYYGLSVLVKDAVDTPADVTESEANDTMETAQAITYPVKVLAFLDPEDIDWYSITVPAETTVELVLETIPVWMMLCLPSDMVATTGYGEECVSEFQCSGDLTCHNGVCTNECEEDGDCADGICFDFGTGGKWCVAESQIGGTPDGEFCQYAWQCAGECFPDAVLQEYYCASECSSDDDCVNGMGCYGEMCVRSLDGVIYPYGNCRLDADCDSELCIDGKCSALCSEAADCEAGVAWEAGQYETCWPCDPNNGNGDCNEGGADGPNYCVTADQVNFFCGVDCYEDPSVCGSGTRCYQIDWFAAVCAPVSFSCEGGAACDEDGNCILATREEGQTCLEDAQCVEGACVNGTCQASTCDADDDCACEDLICTGSYCAIDETGKVIEVEPNGTPDDAQLLDGSVTVVAQYLPQNSQPDKDLFKIHLDAGQALDVWTAPFCDAAPDTYLRLLTADGTPIEGWENDDINSQGYFFSILLGYIAESSQDVLIEVTQSSYETSLLMDRYLLITDVYDVTNNNSCGDAEEIELSVDVPTGYELVIGDATNTLAMTGCVTYGALGKDVFFTVTVPDDHLLEVSLDSNFDGQLYLFESCETPADSCVAGADAVAAAGIESLIWVNNTGAEKVMILGVDSYMPLAEMYGQLDLLLTEVVAPQNDTIEGAEWIGESGTVQGSLTGANDDYNPGVEGCTGISLRGPDVTYGIYLGGGDFVSIKSSSSYSPLRMYLYDDADPMNCVASGNGLLTFEVPDVKIGPNYYLVVDTTDEAAYGPFTLNVVIGKTGLCEGLCDPASFAVSCEEEKGFGLCQCDSATHTLTVLDCNASCQDNGAASGKCHEFTTPGREGIRCMCDYDCETVQTQCSDMIYTNCTCAASDPCVWQDDTFCDEYCAYEYPGDYFDDNTDCASK